MKLFCACLSSVALLGVPFANGAVLDQSQTVLGPGSGPLGIGGSSFQRLAQVVTSGASGSLTAIGLPVAGSGTLRLQIEGVSDGIPNGVVLATQNFPGSSFPDFLADPTGFRHLDLSSPVGFTAGDRFAIVLSALNPPTDSFGLLSGPLGDPYQGGNGFFESRPNVIGKWTPLGDFGRFDLPFQTYVTPVPEPGALGLVVLAGCVAVTMRRGRS